MKSSPALERQASSSLAQPPWPSSPSTNTDDESDSLPKLSHCTPSLEIEHIFFFLLSQALTSQHLINPRLQLERQQGAKSHRGFSICFPSSSDLFVLNSLSGLVKVCRAACLAAKNFRQRSGFSFASFAEGSPRGQLSGGVR